MAILFGTTQSRYPDTGATVGSGSIADQSQAILNGALGLAGARIFNQSFVEDGVQSVNGSVFKGSTVADLEQPSVRRVLTQAPQATVIIKKKMFGSLRSNYDLRFLDNDERLFIRAAKHLLRRKCEEVAFYENLINIEKIIQDPSFLSIDGILTDMLDAISTAADIGQGLGGAVGDLISSLEARFPFLGDLQRLAKTNERAKQFRYTTWVVDPDQPNFSGTGPGCGTIELTMFTKIDTKVSREPGGGSASLTIEDPYQLTLITEADVDVALTRAVQEQGGQSGVLDQIAKANMETATELDRQLNSRLRLRGASEVNFDIPLGTNTHPRGQIIETNQSFGQEHLDEDGGQTLTDLGFDSFEQATIRSIFHALESYKSLQLRTAQESMDENIRTGPVRQRLRAEFVGHHLIQPMDTIHVFANSFTRQETPMYAGSPEIVSGNFLESMILSEEQAGRISDEALEDERLNLAPNLPLAIYKLLRNPLEWRATGPQIFSGLVDEVSPSYDSTHGQFHLHVSAKDNYRFLELSQINTTPSLSQPEGVLMDPLTPFDLIKDDATDIVIGHQLSQINKERLRFLKTDNGATIENEQALANDTGKSVKIWQHVPGIVYKWKSGIVVNSLNINLGQTLDPSDINIDDVSDDQGIHVLDGPGAAFSNLDPADIVSILTTGQPYNYNSFVRNALEVGTLTVDTDTNNRSYFNTLFDFLDRQNEIWGGFVPAKDSVIDPQKSASMFARQRQLAKNVTKINSLQRELARLRDLQRSTGGKDLNAEIERLEGAISTETARLNSGDEFTEKSPLKFFGSSVEVDMTADDNMQMSGKLKQLVKKKPEEVRFNQDKNYLIVSDKYDVDLDIQAFVLNLRDSSPELFKSDWKRSSEICKEVANMLDFEFFADSQGNIRFRPPEYNKTPLSLLLKMVELGRSNGISLAPPFLLKLMGERTKLVADQLLVIELEILEQATLLGLAPANLSPLFNIRLALNSLPGNRYSLDQSAIIDEGKKHAIFTEDQQQNLTFDQKFKPALGLQISTSGSLTNPLSLGVSEEALRGVEAVADIRNQLAELRGPTKPKIVKDPTSLAKIAAEMERFNTDTVGSFGNRLAVTNKIAQLVSKRQTTIGLFTKLVDSQKSVAGSNEGFGILPSFEILPEALGSLLDGSPQDTPAIPKFLEDLIENDLGNYDGFNSGKRFVINDESVLQMNIGIRPPEFTRVDVTGNQNLVSLTPVVGELGGGAAILWAGATDFDMWRQYGFINAQPINKAFLQDPETQCAPYAVFKLAQQRRKIHSGTIKVIGNEHYQVGDVVYVNSRQLMYYVEEVSHSIDIDSGTFTTTLQLSYGRPLGEYIPTPLDMIGKTMLVNSNRPYGNTRIVRNLTPYKSGVVLDTVVIPNTQPIESEVGEVFSRRSESFQKINQARIQNAIRRAKTKIDPGNQNCHIEVRSYFTSVQPSGPAFNGSYAGPAAAAATASAQNSDVAHFFAFQTRRLLSGQGFFPPSMSVESGQATPSSFFGGTGDNPFISADKITVHQIDIAKPLKDEDLEFKRVPSEQAWANAIDPVYGTTSGLPVNSIDIVLVIDRSVNPNGQTESQRNAQAAPPVPAPSTNASASVAVT